MLVSIVIPCYNYALFLNDAVQSVVDQTYTKWECLIIDDGSKDNTAEVAKQLAEKHTGVYYHYKDNGGLSSARNYGIERAKGSFICFLDADDLLDKNKLLKQVDCFTQNPNADIVYGKAMFFETSDPSKIYGNKLKSKESSLPTFSGKGTKLIALLTEQNLTVVSSPLLRIQVFAKTGNFDPAYKSYEDWHFWIRCALAGIEFKYCGQPAVSTYIRFGHESMMSDKRKLILAGVQLRKFMAKNLPLRFKVYNFYRLTRSRLKLFIS
ncbi:hypothetical protein CNR22_19330 [Sphingobacteriaceae bacterium]|nr:hypothetical protein CNR22_19330 [Sphingobacteriaceae bacterium]